MRHGQKRHRRRRDHTCALHGSTASPQTRRQRCRNVSRRLARIHPQNYLRVCAQMVRQRHAHREHGPPVQRSLTRHTSNAIRPKQLPHPTSSIGVTATLDTVVSTDPSIIRTRMDSPAPTWVTDRTSLPSAANASVYPRSSTAIGLNASSRTRARSSVDLRPPTSLWLACCNRVSTASSRPRPAAMPALTSRRSNRDSSACTRASRTRSAAFNVSLSSVRRSSTRWARRSSASGTRRSAPSALTRLKSLPSTHRLPPHTPQQSRPQRIHALACPVLRFGNHLGGRHSAWALADLPQSPQS